MESWVGMKNVVFCSGYNVSTILFNRQKRSLAFREHGSSIHVTYYGPRSYNQLMTAINNAPHISEFVTTRTTIKTTRTTSLRQLGPLFEDNSDHFLGQLGPNLMAIHPVPLNANWYSHRQKLTISFTNFFYLKHDFIQLYLFFRQIFSKFIYPKRQYISEHIK